MPSTIPATLGVCVPTPICDATQTIVLDVCTCDPSAITTGNAVGNGPCACPLNPMTNIQSVFTNVVPGRACVLPCSIPNTSRQTKGSDICTCTRSSTAGQNYIADTDSPLPGGNFNCVLYPAPNQSWCPKATVGQSANVCAVAGDTCLLASTVAANSCLLSTDGQCCRTCAAPYSANAAGKCCIGASPICSR